MMLTPLQLLFVHHNPSFDKACTWCWRECKKRVWSTKCSQWKSEHDQDQRFSTMATRAACSF